KNEPRWLVGARVDPYKNRHFSGQLVKKPARFSIGAHFHNDHHDCANQENCCVNDEAPLQPRPIWYETNLHYIEQAAND
ncbi:hypothetical protein IK146_00005, partial [Candidatus Saccharibacteria bacterium]|nr:hypothetical protein [Candidatus Saccharibacteria bacterium]